MKFIYSRVGWNKERTLHNIGKLTYYKKPIVIVYIKNSDTRYIFDLTDLKYFEVHP